jgi:hypothetical protein
MPDPLAPIALGPEAPRLLVATGRVVRGLDLSRLPYLGLSAGSQPVEWLPCSSAPRPPAWRWAVLRSRAPPT